MAWRHDAFEPVDAASTAVFRMVLGLCVAIGAVRYVVYGWADLLYREPTFFFTWPGFDWVRPMPGAGMYLVYGVLAAFAVGTALGWYTRMAAVGMFATFVYIELIDKTNYLNHYYLISLLALLACVLPVHRGWALDALRRPAADTVPAWVVWTLRAQVGVVYFFAGVAKLDADWLLHGEPLHIWLSTKTDFPVVGFVLDERWLAVAMAWGGALFDLSVPFLLVFRRTRALGYALVVGFHVATGLLFNIGVFPILMMGLTPIFFEPDWPRRALAWVGVRARVVRDALPATRVPRRVVLAALVGWFALQVGLPMRHLAYPGDVRWTQEGFRFSWRVLLVESRGFFKYRIVDPATGQQWVVRPEDRLTPRQRHTASSNPDMILHLAHALADEWARDGHPGVEVYADAWLSHSGRPSVRFVDPGRDLARVPRTGLAPWDWVLPQRGSMTPSGQVISANGT